MFIKFENNRFEFCDQPCDGAVKLPAEIIVTALLPDGKKAVAELYVGETLIHYFDLNGTNAVQSTKVLNDVYLATIQGVKVIDVTIDPDAFMIDDVIITTEDGKYMWYDEQWALHGPCDTLQEAIDAVNKYARTL